MGATQRTLGAAMACCSLAACAYVDTVPVGPNSDVPGIRIPAIKPLLVVGSQVGVLLVPNPNRQLALRFWTFLAKNELTVDFQHGMLQSLNSKQDTTPVPVAFLSALGQAAAGGHNLLGAAFAAQTGGGAAELQIYDIVFDDAGNLVGLRPLITPVPVTSSLNMPQPQPGAGSANPPNPPPATPLPGIGAR